MRIIQVNTKDCSPLSQQEQQQSPCTRTTPSVSRNCSSKIWMMEHLNKSIKLAATQDEETVSIFFGQYAIVCITCKEIPQTTPSVDRELWYTSKLQCCNANRGYVHLHILPCWYHFIECRVMIPLYLCHWHKPLSSQRQSLIQGNNQHRDHHNWSKVWSM